MTPRLDILNRMPGVRIQPVGGGGTLGPVVAKKSAPPPPPSYQEFYAGREDFDSFQGGGGSSDIINELRRVKKAHTEKVFATTEQKKILMDNYLMNNYPSIEDMNRMTEVTGLDERFLKQWFQYTRKFMKSKGKTPVRIEFPPESQQGYPGMAAPRIEKEFVSFQYDPSDAVDTKLDKDSFTHEEAIEKAMQYDNLKKKFDELHKNFMTMSNALLKKGYRGDDDPEPAPTPSQSQRSSPPVQEPSENGKEEPQENGDKTLNGPFRPPVDSTSTPLVTRVKQEKEEEGEKEAKKEPIDDENKDDPSKNMNLPMFPQESNPNPYAPPYHPGPYPPHPMYPPYQAPYNHSLPPHMQHPPNWPPYQQPGWNPNYPPYGSAGYPPSSYPPPGQAPPSGYPPGQAPPSGYPSAQTYPLPPNGNNFQQPPQPSYPGQTPPPSNPFHSTPPPPQVAGQTPPPPPFHQPQHHPYPPHPYHLQAPQYPSPQDPNNPPPPFPGYSNPQDPGDQMQMKVDETKVKTESVSPPPPTDAEMTE